MSSTMMVAAKVAGILIQLPLFASLVVSAIAQDDLGQVDAPLGVSPQTVEQLPSEELPSEERSAQWQYFASVPIPPMAADQPVSAQPPLIDLLLGPDVFSQSRLDLADLRLFDAAGQPYPYALRYLTPKSVRDVVPAKEFNRTEPAAEPHELTLELEPENVQHNEVQVVTTGKNFRRAVEVEGSEDGQQWRLLVAANLIRFTDENQKINIDSIKYLDSRLRYVRIRVQHDPNPSEEAVDNDDLRITEAKVLRTVEIPGERSQWPTVVGKREPTRIYNAPGSAWIVDLQGRNVPCDRIDVEVEGAEFVRDVQIQAELAAGPFGGMAFVPLSQYEETSWQRKLGEPKRPMSISFPEIQTGRLRLLITDYRNAPLTIRAATVSASARQVVFARPVPDSDLRLYFGNPNADLPNYDFARNLAEKLETTPVRSQLSTVMLNPDFVPPPQPFTERFPWLIYVVLGCVVALLLAVIVSLARSAISIHDAELRQPMA